MAIKKSWYEIIAPKMFGEVCVGETPAADPKLLVGRVIKVSMADIDKTSPKFFLKMVFRIDSVEGSKALTSFIGHDIMYERIYRMVQRRTSRIDCVRTVATTDGTKMRIKVVLIIPKKVGNSVQHTVRAKLSESVDKVVSENSVETIIKMILSDDFQRTIRDECKKMYPIAMVEIRKSEIIV
ncbi:MAG: hypothetical protein ABIA21_00125 [Candidatus Aenigmatarchaeota archaeon]